MERPMTQQTLPAFDTACTAPADRVGFEIGWDHARHALVPDAELLRADMPVGQGWHAARAVFGRRTLAAGRSVRAWLRLRLQAWSEGAAFELLQVTPNYLAQIESACCPVTRRVLGGLPGGDDDAVVVRLRADAGYAAGNLAMLSRAAARAMAGRDAAAVTAVVERLSREAQPDSAPDGLDAAAWARLAALMSFAADLPPVQAARMPLRVLPPNRVRVLSPLQGLQVVLTLRLSAPGWSRRARAVAELLPDPALRHDFTLFVGAIAPRLMTIPADATPRALRWAQEDAWADARVQRRWQHLASQLGSAQAESLLQRLAESGLAGVTGVRLMLHGRAAATDGWALASRGRLAVSPRRAASGDRRRMAATA
jgi:hypothetical protein